MNKLPADQFPRTYLHQMPRRPLSDDPAARANTLRVAANVRGDWVIRMHDDRADFRVVDDEDMDASDWKRIFERLGVPSTELDAEVVATIVDTYLPLCAPFPTCCYNAGGTDGMLDMEQFPEHYAEYLYHLTFDEILFELCCTLRCMMERRHPDRTFGRVCDDLVVFTPFHRMKLTVLSEMLCGCDRELEPLDEQLNQTIVYILRHMDTPHWIYYDIKDEFPSLEPFM